MEIQLTEHFNSDEWLSHSTGIAYPVNEIDDEDPQGLSRPWLETRLRPQAEMLEKIRRRIGHSILHTRNGGYRPESQQQRIVDAHPEEKQEGVVASASTSQHPKGRASDIYCSDLAAMLLHNIILTMFYRGELPEIGGLGLYPTFVHVDVRRRPGAIDGQPSSGHLARWGGERSSNEA